MNQPSELTRALLIRNPRAGGRHADRKLEKILARLRAGGYEIEIEATQFADHATELAENAVEKREVELVFAYGGDGTAREVAAGLLGSQMPMALLPSGTANVLARALELPGDGLEAAALYARGPTLTREMDVGTCAGRIFLMMASGGPDAVALTKVSPALKRRFGRAAVAGTALRVVATTDLPEIGIRIGDRRETTTIFSASNIPYYGGNFLLAPEAKLDDGLLDLVLFRGTTRADLAAFLIALFRTRHHLRDDVSISTTRHLTIESPAEIILQLDGDPFRVKTPVEIGISRKRLMIAVPPSLEEVESSGPAV